MRKVLLLGKVDYNNSGRRNCKATIEWELTEDGNFAMSADIWNPRGTDIYCGGQCVDEVASYFPGSKKVQRMVEVWKRWHLNDLNPECEHQRALGQTYNTHPLTVCPTCGYKLGSAWLKEEIPQEIKDEIMAW